MSNYLLISYQSIDTELMLKRITIQIVIRLLHKLFLSVADKLRIAYHFIFDRRTLPNETIISMQVMKKNEKKKKVITVVALWLISKIIVDFM